MPLGKEASAQQSSAKPIGAMRMHRKKNQHLDRHGRSAGRYRGGRHGIQVVSFMAYVLGYIDLEQKTFQTTDTPFGARVPPMSEVRSVTYAFGMEMILWCRRRDSNPRPTHYECVALPPELLRQPSRRQLHASSCAGITLRPPVGKPGAWAGEFGRRRKPGTARRVAVRGACVSRDPGRLRGSGRRAGGGPRRA